MSKAVDLVLGAATEPTATGLAMRARTTTRFEAVEATAYRLYVKAGNSPDCWGVEDENTRLHYLLIADKGFDATMEER